MFHKVHHGLLSLLTEFISMRGGVYLKLYCDLLQTSTSVYYLTHQSCHSVQIQQQSKVWFHYQCITMYTMSSYHHFEKFVLKYCTMFSKVYRYVPEALPSVYFSLHCSYQMFLFSRNIKISFSVNLSQSVQWSS